MDFTAQHAKGTAIRSDALVGNTIRSIEQKIKAAAEVGHFELTWLLTPDAVTHGGLIVYTLKENGYACVFDKTEKTIKISWGHA